MKRKLIFILSIGVIIIGLFLLIYPMIINKIIEAKSSQYVDEFNNISIGDIKNNMERIAEYNFNGINEINALNIYKNIKNINNDYIIGQIVIRDVSMNLPIMKGISNSNLAAGAATMREEQKMGEGNYALAGHYNKSKYVLFGGIMYLKKGSIILITDKKYVYEYMVYDTKIASDTSAELISDMQSIKKGKPVITLMTCYYSSKTGKRYFVFGELIKKYPYSKNILL